MMRLAATFAVTLAAGSALAEPFGCDFTVECIAGEACGATSFSARIIAADHEAQLFLSTVTGESPVIRLTEAGALPATYASAGRDGLAEMMTIEGDLTALLTVHVFDGTAQTVTYFGTCEAL